MKEIDKSKIINTIKVCLRNKFVNYKPETENMPFHYRLLGKDRMALFSFIQSLNTTFGTSIYEPVAKALAENNFKDVETQFKLDSNISQKSQEIIQKIMNNLTVGGSVNKSEEIKKIAKVAQFEPINQLKPIKVDLFLITKHNEVFMFDLKTVKPNKGDFESYKRNLLQWVAIYLYKNPDAKINTLLAIPYNPYEPKLYARWTMKGMLDLKEEVMVAEEFWDFLAGKGTYDVLLHCFERAGIELRPEIDNYFNKFK